MLLVAHKSTPKILSLEVQALQTWPKHDFLISFLPTMKHPCLQLAYLSFPSTLHTLLLPWLCSRNSASPVSSVYHVRSEPTYHENVILSIPAPYFLGCVSLRKACSESVPSHPRQASPGAKMLRKEVSPVWTPVGYWLPKTQSTSWESASSCL